MTPDLPATFSDVVLRTVQGYSGVRDKDISDAGLPVDAVLAASKRDADNYLQSSLQVCAETGIRDLHTIVTGGCTVSFINGLLIGVAWERERSR